LLPTFHDDAIPSAIDPVEVTKVAIRLRYLLEECIPCELEEDTITKANSKVITKAVIKAAKEAGGREYGACVVYCLLVNKRWFKKQATLELWDADLHNVRAVACEVIAKQLYSSRCLDSDIFANCSRIETEDDQDYLLQDVLLKRYSIMIDGQQTQPANVIERSVDLHALRVTGSSGYQKCINYLWRGWLVQDENDPSTFVDYKRKDNTRYWVHVHPDRMRAPVYQNATQIVFSLIYLALYSQAIATVNPTGDIDVIEVILYIFTFGFLCDEFSKLWKVGRYYIGFWNVFNIVLYALNELSYNFLGMYSISTSGF
jgi:hypothetical protein